MYSLTSLYISSWYEKERKKDILRSIICSHQRMQRSNDIFFMTKSMYILVINSLDMLHRIFFSGHTTMTQYVCWPYNNDEHVRMSAFFVATHHPENLKMQFASSKLIETSYQGSPLFPFRLITASSCSTNSPAHIDGYLLASGDSAKWPKGFNTASDAMWENNYIWQKEQKKNMT